jgi:CheY-like chemotaxis protein
MTPRKKVLICEDNEVERKAIQLAVEGEGIETVLVPDGRKAIAQLEEANDFDLIITDIHMPYKNGDDILELVRRQQGRATPIVMISSDREEEVIKLALKLGVDEFIEKPIDPKVVRKKLKRFL